MNARNAAKGFTLIELLVVIAIIGILSSIVLASLNTARLKSRDARRVADIKQIQLAMQLYYDANSSYPTDIYAASGSLMPTYIATVPSDPVGQVQYAYERLSSGSSYQIGANLEDLSNQALNSDLDVTGTVVKGADTGDCAGVAVATSNRKCYDVGP